jgi:hypothetical protein
MSPPSGPRPGIFADPTPIEDINMRLILLLGLLTAVLMTLSCPLVSAAEAGFAIGPPSLKVELPADGSSKVTIFVTSEVDGELVVGSEGIPFRVEPDRIPITNGDRYREIELTLYGDESQAEGHYTGKLTFLIYTSETVAYGVKLDAEITQINGESGFERFVKTLQASYVLIIVGVMVLVALFIWRRRKGGGKGDQPEGEYVTIYWDGEKLHWDGDH